MYMFKDRRLGRIQLLAATVDEDLETVRDMFVDLEFVSFSVYHLFLTGTEDTMEFTGNSPKFRMLEDNESIPRYIIETEQSEFEVWDKDQDCWVSHYTTLFTAVEIK